MVNKEVVTLKTYYKVWNGDDTTHVTIFHSLEEAKHFYFAMLNAGADAWVTCVVSETTESESEVLL